jgi:small nuclear ribonucleoprotein (snRNP)-like protein
MAFSRRRGPPRRHPGGRPKEQRANPDRHSGVASTGSEAEYLKSLVDMRSRVTVVLKNGESVSGHIRYYDQDCFSIGPESGGAKIFLRKSSVSYIREE